MKLLFLLLFFSLTACSTPQQNLRIDETFYKDCMETIQEKEKCDTLVKKREDREKKREIEQIKLTEEQLQGLELRDSFKNRMMGKSKLAVIKDLGDPDERTRDGGAQDFFYYRKPLTRFSAEHDPDKEIIIVFRKEFVSRVLHTPPDTTPNSIIPFFGDKPKIVPKK
ncbi:MAG: hypothetical protein IPL26_14745 [Leptospiraceae bacterium]|nr:hypothetical protein [Leptospiraceae bacterium]